MELEQRSLQNIGKRKFKVGLKSKDLTNVNNPDQVIELVQLFLNNQHATDTDFSKPYQFKRVLALARNLGLIDGNGLTNNSRALLELGSKGGKYGFLATLFEKSTLGRSFIEWSGSQNITSSMRERTRRFIQERFPDLAKNTQNQYSAAIGKLISDLFPHHPNNKSESSENNFSEDFTTLIGPTPIFENRVIDTIDRVKEGTKLLRIPTGFMSAQGYDMVAKNLKDAEIRILLGKDDERGRQILADPLNNFSKSIRNGIHSHRKSASHRRLYRELVEGTARVRRTTPKMIEALHGKGFFGDRRWAISTSSNLSRAGLEKNIETGYLISEKKDVDFYVDKFDGLWEEAEDITTEIIEEIVESWVFQEPVKPYFAYLRGLNEIYGSLASKDISKKYKLATFQKMIVGSTIRSLTDRNAALMIAPTGTGKTVMGSYIMAAMKKKYEKVVVLLPNEDLERKWREHGLSFGIHPLISTHKKLQVEPEEFVQSEIGKELDMYVDDNTLIVVDEAHRFRTEKSKGHLVLDYILKGNFNDKKPGILLLTATPIGTGFENLNSLYGFLSLEDNPEEIGDLKECPGLINVTLPFIIERFGEEDSEGNTFLKFGDVNMYYAKRHQMIAPYDDENGKIYSLIKEIDFTELKDLEPGETRLNDFGFDLEPLTKDVMTFNRQGLAQAVNSSNECSMERIGNLIDKIEDRDYVDEMKTLSQLLTIKEMIVKERKDKRYQIALNIINDKHPSGKGIINVNNIATRKALVEKLSRDTGKNIEEYDGTKAQKRKKRERFAPKANNAKIKKKNRIDILVASGGLAEGHDMQDADFIINFDLWWTPLVQQQRMGRLDRPTDEPREFSVYHIVNINQTFQSVVSMDEKLRNRSETLKKIIGDGAYEINHYRNWEELDKQGIIAISADEDDFDIEEMVATSQHIADLANATQEDIGIANNLPTGFKAGMNGLTSGTYVMISSNGNIYTGFKHEDGIMSYAPGDKNFEKLLEYIRAEKETPEKLISENHLQSVELVTKSLCEKNHLDYQEITTIFSVCVEP